MSGTKTDRINHSADTAAHTSFDNLSVTRRCTFVQHYFQTDMLHGTICKDACGIFGTNRVIRMLFVSQKVERFCDKACVTPGQDAGVDVLVIVSPG